MREPGAIPREAPAAEASVRPRGFDMRRATRGRRGASWPPTLLRVGHPFPRHSTTPPIPIAQLTLKPEHAGVTAQVQARGAVPHGLSMHFELTGPRSEEHTSE